MKYEIRQIGTEKVFIKSIAHNFWLVNNAYISAFDGYELTDKEIMAQLSMFQDELFPYEGAENESVIGLSLSPVDGSVIAGYYHLFDFSDEIAASAREAYNEYKNWSRV